jgi:RES domain-containing protein
VVVWRLLRRPFSRAPLSGEGARLHGGRWNPPGVALVYTSASLSLAALEQLVHADPADLLPSDLVAVEIRVPDRLRVEEVRVDSLPRDWARHPAPDTLASLGAAWVSSGRTALLRVPSAVVPTESNLLVNPAHPDAARLLVRSRSPFSFDPRLRGGR